MDNAASDWTLPVNFYFLVDFQSKFDHFQTSFMEVSGLEMRLKSNKKKNDSNVDVNMPTGISYGKITLKRAVPTSNNDIFTQWAYKCLKADKEKMIVSYDMIIKILDQEGKPVVGWNCSHAYPLKWSLGDLNAQKSDLVMETVVMGCNRIDRIKI